MTTVRRSIQHRSDQRAQAAYLLVALTVEDAEDAFQAMLHARAVEVPEAMATADAHALLTRWSTGDPAAVLTGEARRALARLGK
jgi:hypothetical protein